VVGGNLVTNGDFEAGIPVLEVVTEILSMFREALKNFGKKDIML